MGRRIDNLDLKATPDLTDYILGYRPGEKGIRFTVAGLASTIGGGGGGGSGTVTSVAIDPGLTGLTFDGGPITSSGTFVVGGMLAIENGGTGATDAGTALANLGAAASAHNQGYTTITSFPTGKIAGRSASGTGALEALTVGTGLSLSGGTLACTVTGTVTSVAASGGSTGLSFSGGPITGSGTLTLSGTLAVANGGTGATDAATARTNLGVAAATHSHSASDVTSGTLAVARGGTGQGTAAAAFDALAPTSTRGDIITRGASSNERLALGRAGAAIYSDGTDSKWGDTANYWDLWDDLLFASDPPASGNYSIAGASGTGAACTRLASETGAQGIIQLETGTTSTGNCRFIPTGSSAVRFGQETWILEVRFRIPTLSNGTDSFYVRLGFMDTTTGSSPIDCVLAEYIHSANSGKWVYKAASNSSVTSSNGNAAPTANTWQTIRFVVGASTADIYVDGTLDASGLSGIPTGSGRETGVRFAIEASGTGTATDKLQIDYYALTILK